MVLICRKIPQSGLPDWQTNALKRCLIKNRWRTTPLFPPFSTIRCAPK